MKKKIDISVFLPRIIFCGLIVYLCVSLITQQFDIARLDKEEKAVEQQISDKEREIKENEAELEKSDSPEAIEQVARDKMGYVKSDEIVFVDANKINN